jgi:hypothetical protein
MMNTTASSSGNAMRSARVRQAFVRQARDDVSDGWIMQARLGPPHGGIGNVTAVTLMVCKLAGQPQRRFIHRKGVYISALQAGCRAACGNTA